MRGWMPGYNEGGDGVILFKVHFLHCLPILAKSHDAN